MRQIPKTLISWKQPISKIFLTPYCHLINCYIEKVKVSIQIWDVTTCIYCVTSFVCNWHPLFTSVIATITTCKARWKSRVQLVLENESISFSFIFSLYPRLWYICYCPSFSGYGPRFQDEYFIFHCIAECQCGNNIHN